MEANLMKTSPSVEMLITELRRSGDGMLEDAAVFKFSGREHSSSQNDLALHLKVTTVRKEMPGSNIVVEQAMSATWQPFDIEGEWDDKWGNRRASGIAGFNRTGSFALFMFQEFAKLVTRMPLVRLELDALSFVGILTDLKVSYRTQTRIGWKVTVSPHTNETITVERPITVAKESIPKWLEKAAEVGQELRLAFAEIRIIPVRTTRFELFQSALLEVNDALSRLEAISLDGLVQDTERKLYLLATTFRRVLNASQRITETLSSVESLTDVAFDDALLSSTYAEWTHASIVAAWKNIGVSRAAERDIRRRAQAKPKAIYYPKRGESLERISMRFYGSANNWRAIYDKNNLSSLLLDGTEELFIPERS